MQDRDLQLSAFVLRARPVARSLGVGLLFVVAVFLIVVALVTGVRTVQGSVAADAMIAQLWSGIVTADIRGKPGPEQFVTTNTAILPTSTGRFDLIAGIKNPSSQWAAVTFDYALQLSGATVAAGTASLFPGEERYLLAFGQQLGSVPASNDALTVAVSNAVWHRATAADPLPERELTVRDAAYQVLSNTASQALSRVTATLRNTGVQQYRDVTVQAVLFHGDTMVGASQVVLTTVRSQEERSLDLRFSRAADVTRVVVLPLVAVPAAS